jgi:hypothetical protein
MAERTLEELLAVINDEDAPPETVVAAAKEVLYRGWYGTRPEGAELTRPAE